MKNKSFNRTFPPAHASNATQSWARAENIEYISEEWPPSSSDLNPFDILYGGYSKKELVQNFTESALVREWQRMPQKSCEILLGS